jgi:hypothetical protein
MCEVLLLGSGAEFHSPRLSERTDLRGGVDGEGSPACWSTWNKLASAAAPRSAADGCGASGATATTLAPSPNTPLTSGELSGRARA